MQRDWEMSRWHYILIINSICYYFAFKKKASETLFSNERIVTSSSERVVVRPIPHNQYTIWV